MFPFIRSIATVAAGVTLGASLLQAGSAQAASFFNFNVQWNNNTTTTGWVAVDDTPEYQVSYVEFYDYKSWDERSLLDARFTHEGTTYGKSDITFMSSFQYDFPVDSIYFRDYGNVYNWLKLSFGNTTLEINDFGAGGDQPEVTPDFRTEG